MNSNAVTKINKLGNAGYVISKIGQVALLIGAIACLVCAVLMCFIPRNAVKIQLSSTHSAVVHLDKNYDLLNLVDLDEEDGILKIGQHSYKLLADDADIVEPVQAVFHLSNIKWVLFSGLFACAATYFVFYFAAKLFAYLKDCTTPFSPDTSKALMNLAWSLIPTTLITSITEAIANSVLIGSADFSLNISLTTILLILCVFLLSFIFKYGTGLQIESDETL